jgi:hypothetical protein
MRSRSRLPRLLQAADKVMRQDKGHISKSYSKERSEMSYGQGREKEESQICKAKESSSLQLLNLWEGHEDLLSSLFTDQG